MSKIEKIDQNSTKTTTNFLYDENGNLLKDASHEYIYDKKARLVCVDNNVSYAYNHENTRVSKTINAETTHFIYDGAKLIGEYNSDGTPKNEYIYLDNIPVVVIPRGYQQDGVQYIHTDHLGTPRRLADENANIVWSWESEPFGESKAVGSVEFDLRFAGQYFDNETSTHYNINRDYNPKTGRYIESDPIGFDGGVNSYGYVAGNPMGAVDEMGLDYGYIFKTINQAVEDYADDYVTDINFNEDRETSTNVKKISAGYTYTKPKIGAKGVSNIQPSPITKDVVIMVHSHGNDKKNSDFQNFSRGDLDFAQLYKIKIGLVTSEYIFKTYQPVKSYNRFNMHPIIKIEARF